MNISFSQLKRQFYKVLLKIGFNDPKATLIAQIFAENSMDGVYSHGANRFPAFIQSVQEGVIAINAEPEVIETNHLMERWDGHLAPGVYTATLAMQRAIDIAKEKSMGCVAVKNANHWMRGGTYGWQAANAGCIGICTTNTIANMPPWGGTEARLGNNPLIIAIPRTDGHLVLDMAMSQFSYGKLQEYELSGQPLPVAGGYDSNGKLVTDPALIRASKRTLPIGFWKGSGLSFMLDVLVAALSGGRCTAQITADGKEYGLSQFFLCIAPPYFNEGVIEEIINYTKSSQTIGEQQIYYPGEKTLATRKRNEQEGIPVNDTIWQQIMNL